MTEEEDIEPKESEKHIEETTENDGRAAKIDINGYYTVQVWGDPDDSLETVMEEVEQAADRATEEIEKLNGVDDSDDKSFD